MYDVAERYEPSSTYLRPSLRATSVTGGREDFSGRRVRELAAIDDRHAVDENVGNPGRVLVRLRERGVIGNLREVEDDDVGPGMLRFAFSAGSPSPRSLCEWMSMKPGDTILPAASIVRAPRACSSRPMAAMRPSLTATSATYHGLPVPSTSFPPTITRSYCGACDDNAPPTRRKTRKSRPRDIFCAAWFYHEASGRLVCSRARRSRSSAASTAPFAPSPPSAAARHSSGARPAPTSKTRTADGTSTM